MKKWHKVVLVVLALWLVGMGILSPKLIKGWHQKKAMDRVFSDYSQALVEQHWNEAYALSSADFQTSTSSHDFAGQHLDLLQRFGKLKGVKQGQTVVEGKGTPPRWAAEIHAELQYEAKSVPMVYWFRSVDGQWRLVGYRQRE